MREAITNYLFSLSYGHLAEWLNNKTNIVTFHLMELSSKPIHEVENIKKLHKKSNFWRGLRLPESMYS